MTLVFSTKTDQIMTHKNKVVNGLTKGIEGLFRKNKVDYLKGVGSFKNQNTVHIKLNDGTEKVIKSKNTIIATGSESNNLPGGILPIDEDKVISSTGELFLIKVL